MTSNASIERQIAIAAQNLASDRLDRFPPLITYRCLAGATDLLAAAASTQFQVRGEGVTETLTMPRRGFGPRPVEVLSPTSRVLYTALVSHLDEALPVASRQEGAWGVHREFGREGDHSYVVELDFASCYELIDHVDLRDELLLRSFDPAAVSAIDALLRGVARRGRGLPQMLHASDRLADAYLDIIDRRLKRSGYRLHRFADDVRVLAADWNQANEIIEEAAGYARSLSLILSSAKTGIRRREVLNESENEGFALLQRYFNDAKSNLSEIVVVDGPYGTPEFDVQDPDDADALSATYLHILQDWHFAFRQAQDRNQPLDIPSGLGGHINSALASVAHQPEAVATDLLEDLVFHDPTRLENVCRYFLERRASGRATKRLGNALLRRLTGMGRQSAWAKLWLLHLAAEVDTLPAEVDEWVRLQLNDPHEVVRAEAAWVSACHGLLESQDLEVCYRRATEITAPSLSASAARQNSASSEHQHPMLQASLVDAILGDGPLNKAASKWVP